MMVTRPDHIRRNRLEGHSGIRLIDFLPLLCFDILLFLFLELYFDFRDHKFFAFDAQHVMTNLELWLPSQVIHAETFKVSHAYLSG